MAKLTEGIKNLYSRVVNDPRNAQALVNYGGMVNNAQASNPVVLASSGSTKAANAAGSAAREAVEKTASQARSITQNAGQAAVNALNNAADYARKTVQNAGSYSPVGGSSGAGSSGSSGEQKVSYVDDGEKNIGVVTPAPEPVPSYWDTRRDEYQKYYDEQVAANDLALENARKRAKEAADAEIAAVTEGYRGTNRQLYRDYMERQRVLPQEMAAQGYSGGLTESSRLRLGNAYQEALAENERARIAQEAGTKQRLSQQLFEAQAAADEANLQARQNRYSFLATLAEKEREEQRQDLEERAAMLGSVGDFSAYKDLGYSDAEIAYLQDMFRRMNPDLFYSSGGGNSSGGGGSSRRTPAVTTQVDQLLKQGAGYSDVLNAIRDVRDSGDLSEKEARQGMAYAYKKLNPGRSGGTGQGGR